MNEDNLSPWSSAMRVSGSQPALVRLDPAAAWRPWEPDARNPWNLKWAGHLFLRAAFGASWDELQTAVRNGLRPTLDRLLAGGPGHAEFDQLADAVAPERGDADGDASGLEWWWLQRMVRTPRPLLPSAVADQPAPRGWV